MSATRERRERKMTADKAFARHEMFTEAADHLDGCVTESADEQAEIPFVQNLLRRNAAKWLRVAHQLKGAAHER
jgi:hypothetical protein